MNHAKHAATYSQALAMIGDRTDPAIVVEPGASGMGAYLNTRHDAIFLSDVDRIILARALLHGIDPALVASIH